MQIFENNIEHLPDFIRLNEEWILKYFALEDADIELAANPSKIIENNGYIFSLVENQLIVGVCALFSEGDGVFEVARLAVSPAHQGKGYGRVLLKTCLTKATEVLHAQKVYLVSNTKLKPAIKLYTEFGFIPVESVRHTFYARGNITLQLNLTR